MNMVIGFAHLGGKSAGIVANQPMILAGCLDICQCKGRTIRTFLRCVYYSHRHLVDVPGFSRD